MGEPKIYTLQDQDIDVQVEFKDGDDFGGGEEITNISIAVVSNGFIVSYFYGDGDEMQEVHKDKEEMLNHIRASLG